MRLGVSTSFNTKSAEIWVKEQKECGCQTVVFPLNAYDSHQKIDEFAQAARENGLQIAEVGVWKNTLAGDAAERKEWIRYAIAQLELAEKIGARCCVNVAGTPHGPRWDGGYAGNFDRQTRKDIIETVRTIIDAVQPKNTKYSLEPMPWMVPTGPDDYLQLISEVERDGFGVHLDVINMVTCPERYFHLNTFVSECFEKLGKRICSCHLKDILLLPEYTFQLRECACGEGVLDIPHYAALATETDTEMPMIIEHLHSDEEYRQSFRYVTQILQNEK